MKRVGPFPLRGHWFPLREGIRSLVGLFWLFNCQFRSYIYSKIVGKILFPHLYLIRFNFWKMSFSISWAWPKRITYLALGSGSRAEATFAKAPPHLHEKRWGHIIKFLEAARVQVQLCRVAWDSKTYVGGNPKGVKRERSLRSLWFFGYYEMMRLLHGSFEELRKFSEACPCHPTTRRHGEAAPDHPCPMNSLRAPEMAAGAWAELLRARLTEGIATLLAETHVVLATEDWTLIADDFDKGMAAFSGIVGIVKVTKANDYCVSYWLEAAIGVTLFCASTIKTMTLLFSFYDRQPCQWLHPFNYSSGLVLTAENARALIPILAYHPSLEWSAVCAGDRSKADACIRVRSSQDTHLRGFMQLCSEPHGTRDGVTGGNAWKSRCTCPDHGSHTNFTVGNFSCQNLCNFCVERHLLCRQEPVCMDRWSLSGERLQRVKRSQFAALRSWACRIGSHRGLVQSMTWAIANSGISPATASTVMLQAPLSPLHGLRWSQGSQSRSLQQGHNLQPDLLACFESQVGSLACECAGGITWCDNFWPNLRLEVAEGLHIGWRMLAAH